MPFEDRACFIAGQAKSGTTLLVALLDSHSELLVLPEETAYFPTVLTKYAPRGRRAQFDYLTKQSLSNVMFALLLMAVTIYFVAFPPEADETDG